jgi:hypothetical protein
MKTKIAALLIAFLLVVPALYVARTVTAQNPISVSVEPVAITPLTDTNSSVNGLETPPTPSPVGKNFTVEIHLRGATTANAPNGIAGIEVHFFFGNILTYCQVTGFTDYTGQAGGALLTPLLFGINPGFFASDGTTKVSSPPYTGAVYYEVAAASTGGAWNGADGLVAKINFTITKQPQGSSGESTVNLQLADDFTDLTDTLASPVTHDRTQGLLTVDAFGAPPPSGPYTLTVNVVGNGTVTIDPMNATYASGTNVTLTAIPAENWTLQSWSGDLTGSQNPKVITMNANKTVTATFIVSGPGIPGDLNHDGVVNLQDLMVFALAWRSTPSSPNWNPDCDLAVPKDYIGLSDLVTFCVIYGASLKP